MKSSDLIKYMLLLISIGAALFSFIRISQVKIKTPFCRIQTNCMLFQSAKGSALYGFPLSTCNGKTSKMYFIVNEKQMSAYKAYLCNNKMYELTKKVNAIHCNMKKGNGIYYTQSVKQYAAIIDSNDEYRNKVMRYLNENKNW